MSQAVNRKALHIFFGEIKRKSSFEIFDFPLDFRPVEG
jgi:hypothetical protein